MLRALTTTAAARRRASKDAASVSALGWPGRLVATCLVIVLVAGCAGVTDQIVALDQPGARPWWVGASSDSAADQRALAEAKYKDLDAALGYAEVAKAKFMQAAVNQGRLSTWTGAAIIPAGALALGLATLGGGDLAAQIIGVSAAGTLGTAFWLRNSPAQIVYLQAHGAVNCAIEVVAPFRVAGQDRAKFDDATARIGDQLSSLAGAITTVEATGESADDVAVAKEILRAGEEAFRNAILLRAEIEGAGIKLVTAVDNIVNQAALAVQANQPDLGAIPGLVSGLAGAYGNFSPIPLSGRQPAEIAPAEIESGRPLVIMRNRAAAVAASTREIAAFVNAVAQISPDRKLAACKIEPGAIVSGLAIDPPGPFTLTAGKPEVRSLILNGGRAPYAASIAGSPRGITLRQTEAFGPTFVIEVAAESSGVSGTFMLVARDIDGRRKTAEIVVASPAQAPTTSNRREATQPAAPTAFSGLTADERKRLQRAICLTGLDADGIWGPTTRAYLEAWQQRQGRIADGELTVSLASNLINLTEAAVADDCRKIVTLRAAANLVRSPFPVPVGSGVVTLDEVDVPKVDPASNHVRMSLTVRSIAPPSGTDKLDCAAIAAFLVTAFDQELVRAGVSSADKLGANDFALLVSDPENRLGTVRGAGVCFQ